jgi:O-antigen ligase
MDVAKKYLVAQKLIFIFLILFPFGQLIRIPVHFNVYSVVLHPVDVVAFAALLFFILGKFKYPPLFISFLGIVFAFFFTWLLSIPIFQSNEVIVGLMYILRLLAYSGLFFLSWSVVSKYPKSREKLLSALIAVLFISAIFGWVQYLIYPDLRTYVVWGWDDHLFRMAGTFFDPGYLAILLVFGLISSLGFYYKTKKKLYLYLVLFFLISVGFTYSRAAYLALFFGITTLVLFWKRYVVIPLMILVMFLGILLLPRPSSSGVELERLYSVYSRVGNYKETIQLWKESPLFGVGYNNLCLARKELTSDISYRSHSCSGADSSALFILVTTGVVGLLVIVGLLKDIKEVLVKNYYTKILISCFVALLVHSLFQNSLFYSWVMGWMLILLSLSVRITQKIVK